MNCQSELSSWARIVDSRIGDCGSGTKRTEKDIFGLRRIRIETTWFGVDIPFIPLKRNNIKGLPGRKVPF
jgi:hypothetical protein